MKKEAKIIFVIILIILVIAIIFLYTKNNSLKIELTNLKNSSLETSKEVTESEDNETEIQDSSTSQEITEELAIEVVDDYRINTLQDTTNSYKFQKIEKETVEIKSTYSAISGNYVIDIKNSTKNVYAVYYSLDDNSDWFIGYVDINTGEMIGFHGEGV